MAPLYWRLLAVLLLAVVRISPAEDEDVYKPYEALRSTDNNFTDSGTYQVNVDKLVHHLRERAANNEGYFHTSFGNQQDTVFGLVMCYADNSWEGCLFCLAHAAAWVGAGCPYSRNVNVNYNMCLLRYSEESFFGDLDLTLTARSGVYSSTNVTDVASMNATRLNLIGRLSGEAASSSRRFAYDRQSYVDSHGVSQVMYALTQCRPDLEYDACKRCLNNVSEELQKASPSNTYGSLLGYSCYVRYDLRGPLEIIQPPPPG
ncbi:hypothetical protein EJB05_00452, partial [Eragrostis curvula]